MNKHFIQDNKTVVSIVIFIAIFATIQFWKPLFLYDTDGSIRQFGIGYRNKTIFPIWLLAIVLGILTYLGVSFYLEM